MDWVNEITKQFSSFPFVSKAQEQEIRDKVPEIVQVAESIADSVPFVGHLKGIYHYVKDEKDKAINSADEATRTTAVITGGISGFALGGAIGAMIGGAVSGTGYDMAASSYHGKPVRAAKAVEEAVACPTNENRFSAALYPILDAFTGYIGADIYSSWKTPKAITLEKTRTFIVNETKRQFTGPNGELMRKKIIETFVIKNPYLQQEAASIVASQLPKIAAFTAIYPYGKNILENIKKD